MTSNTQELSIHSITKSKHLLIVAINNAVEIYLVLAQTNFDHLKMPLSQLNVSMRGSSSSVLMVMVLLPVAALSGGVGGA